MNEYCQAPEAEEVLVEPAPAHINRVAAEGHGHGHRVAPSWEAICRTELGGTLGNNLDGQLWVLVLYNGTTILLDQYTWMTFTVLHPRVLDEYLLMVCHERSKRLRTPPKDET